MEKSRTRHIFLENISSRVTWSLVADSLTHSDHIIRNYSFLNHCKVSQKSSISHYLPHHNANKTIHSVKKIPSSSQLPPIHLIGILVLMVCTKNSIKHTHRSKKSTVKKRHVQIFCVINNWWNQNTALDFNVY